MNEGPQYRLFSWEHSYFSGKIRAYLRYKDHFGGLGPGFEDVFATQEIIQKVLLPATGENAVPQLQSPDGEFIQDTSLIIDFCEERHPEPSVIPSPVTSPRQNLASYLIELLADEWMLVYGYWERWHYSLAGVEPNHEKFNAQQWGPTINPKGTGPERAAGARWFFDTLFHINDPENATIGPYIGLIQLGMTQRTEAAWSQSFTRLLERLEEHFGVHDYVLGGLPTLADFALVGPLYAHIYRDAVTGFMLRRDFPVVAEWVERTVATNALNARSYNQKMYDVDDGGRLVGRPATRDEGRVLADDRIPDTLLPILDVFFEEMWPVLESSMRVLGQYLASGQHPAGTPLPGKSFGATPGCEAQLGDGALTHEFEIGGVRERRMVLPYQVWMLQRVGKAMGACRATPEGARALTDFLERWPAGARLLALDEALADCRVRKVKGTLYAAEGADG